MMKAQLFCFSMLPQQARQIREEENHHISRKCNILGQVFMRVWPRQRKVKLNEDAAGSWLVHLLMLCVLHDRRHYRDSTKSRKSISRLLEAHKLAWKCRYRAQTGVKERLLNKGQTQILIPAYHLLSVRSWVIDFTICISASLFDQWRSKKWMVSLISKCHSWVKGTWAPWRNTWCQSWDR